MAIIPSLCLLPGPGKRTASGPVHPAIQQPPKLCFTTQPNASSCFQPSVVAPPPTKQWTLKTAGEPAEGPPSTKQMGGPGGKWTM